MCERRDTRHEKKERKKIFSQIQCNRACRSVVCCALCCAGRKNTGSSNNLPEFPRVRTRGLKVHGFADFRVRRKCRILRASCDHRRQSEPCVSVSGEDSMDGQPWSRNAHSLLQQFVESCSQQAVRTDPRHCHLRGENCPVISKRIELHGKSSSKWFGAVEEELCAQ